VSGTGHLLVAPGVGTAPALAGLLAHLARRHRVHAHDPGLGAPAAVLTRPGANRSLWRDAPRAWWVEEPSELPAVVDERVRLVIAARPLDGLGVPVEVAPSPAVDGSALRPVLPYVRGRWRRRFGLPDDLVVRVGVPGAPVLDDETAGDALFLCAAAVVGPGHVLRSLALGTPTVCDAATAAAVGAVDGVHVVVADDDDAAAALAGALAGDELRGAALARSARRLVEARHDVAAAARRVARALALPAVGALPLARLADALVELGTPLDARITGRVAGAVGGLGDVGPLAAVRSLRW
jgi:hypothetical protein